MTAKESDEARKEVGYIELFCLYKIKHMTIYTFVDYFGQYKE